MVSILHCGTHWVPFHQRQVRIEQGDPLGTLLFCLVLQQVVSAIAEDADCASLLFHQWYIDDGAVAGPTAAIARVLTIIQDLGPPLGLYINTAKCESYSLSDLSTFPEGDEAIQCAPL